MKVLIWEGFVLAVSGISALFRLGLIPRLLVYLAAFYAARALCKAWDEKKKGAAEIEAPALTEEEKKTYAG